ncbi:MAG: hypothetical protein UV51_C0007G0031 [Candidatus Woesebacteria bacterium GW2011_GWC1_42_9]|nr:MAG: hypothetical protein UV51_C0007G0031 [Candidatus Woesebacteria bacterium GW2011_GWC1_42_9]
MKTKNILFIGAGVVAAAGIGFLVIKALKPKPEEVDPGLPERKGDPIPPKDAQTPLPDGQQVKHIGLGEFIPTNQSGTLAKTLANIPNWLSSTQGQKDKFNLTLKKIKEAIDSLHATGIADIVSLQLAKMKLGQELDKLNLMSPSIAISEATKKSLSLSNYIISITTADNAMKSRIAQKLSSSGFYGMTGRKSGSWSLY